MRISIINLLWLLGVLLMGHHLLIAALFCLLLVAEDSLSFTVPFTEDFSSGNSNWSSNLSNVFLVHIPTGGPDGSSYASGTFNFQNSAAGTSPVLLRANNTTSLGPASGGNFIGDWISAGAKRFSAFVRHDAPVPLTYFARFADPANFPGAFATHFAPVLPHTWTELVFSVRPGSPAFVTFEGSSFANVFDNIGRVQLGVSVPVALAGTNQSYKFDVDQAAVNSPEPTTLLLGALAATLVLLLRPGTS
jgi:hypothetical protein